jgi:hypothetical protein
VSLIDLNGEIPQRILVTVGFGFVVVYSFGHLQVYTINGSRVCERRIDWQIVEWSAFVNDRGFDFIVVLNERGEVFSMEVFNLEQSNIVLVCKEAIAALKYDTVTETVVVVAADGSGYLIPHQRQATSPF